MRNSKPPSVGVNPRICYQLEGRVDTLGGVAGRVAGHPHTLVRLISKGEVALVTWRTDINSLHVLARTSRERTPTADSAMDVSPSEWAYIGVAASCGFRLRAVRISGDGDTILLHCLDKEPREINRATTIYEMSVIKLLVRIGRYSWLEDEGLRVEKMKSYWFNYQVFGLSFLGDVVVVGEFSKTSKGIIRVYRKALGSQSLRWTIQMLSFPVELDDTGLSGNFDISGDGKTIVVRLFTSDNPGAIITYRQGVDGVFQWEAPLVPFESRIPDIFDGYQTALSFDGTTLVTAMHSQHFHQFQVFIFYRSPSHGWYRQQVIDNGSNFLKLFLSSSGNVLFLSQFRHGLRIYSRLNANANFTEQPEIYKFEGKLNIIQDIHMTEDASSFIIGVYDDLYEVEEDQRSVGGAFVFRQSADCLTTTAD